MGKRLLFKKEHAYAKRGVDTVVHSSDEWGIMACSFPVKYASDIKPPYANAWNDEDGDDELVPDEPKFKAYEITVDFVYKGVSAQEHISAFVEYLAYGGQFSMMDEHSGIGRQKVRFAGYEEDASVLNGSDGDTVTFSLKFKINDPVTRIVLEK